MNQETLSKPGLRTGSDALIQTVAFRAIKDLAGTVANRLILEIDCGEGNLTRWFARHGANVTGVDRSMSSVETARAGNTADTPDISYLVGEAEDLYMIDDTAFDDVVCNLSLARMELLSPVIAEVARVIQLGGRFMFTVAHPCFDQQILRGGRNMCDYYAEGVVAESQDALIHRTLATYINAVAARGFTVRRVLEPSAADCDLPAPDESEEWCNVPVVLAVEAVFPHF